MNVRIRYNTNQAFELLQAYGITKSKQVLYRWLRSGALPSTKVHKEHCLTHEDLMAFIEKKADPFVLQLVEENNRLKQALATSERP